MNNTTSLLHQNTHLEALGIERALTWEDLTAIFDEFPKSMCDRSRLVIHLYEDGALSEEVTHELKSHLVVCPLCEEYLRKSRSLFSELDTSSMYYQSINDKDIDQSFDLFLSQYGTTLFGDVEEANMSYDAPPSHLVLEVPAVSKTRRSIKVKTFGGLVLAAAFLFAYGPALIEGPIEESTYPKVENIHSQSTDQSLALSQGSLPLMKEVGHDILGEDLSTTVKLLNITLTARHGSTSVATYDLGFKGITRQIQMTQVAIQSSQANVLRERLSTSEERIGELLIRSNRSEKLISLEYVLNDHHIRWATHEIEAEDMLRRLAMQHYQNTLK